RIGQTGTAEIGRPPAGQSGAGRAWSCARAMECGPQTLLVLTSSTVSQSEAVVAAVRWSCAAWAPREGSNEGDTQAPGHRCDGVRYVSQGPDRGRLWVGNRRVAQCFGLTWGELDLRGESSPVRRSGSRRRRCRGWRGDGSHANFGLRNDRGRLPA